MKVSVITSSY